MHLRAKEKESNENKRKKGVGQKEQGTRSLHKPTQNQTCIHRYQYGLHSVQSVTMSSRTVLCHRRETAGLCRLRIKKKLEK